MNNDDKMILEFVDGTQIIVNTIIGGPAIVGDNTRDVLTIEIDPNSISIANLESKFHNIKNLAHLYTYEIDEETGNNCKLEIGEGYTMVLKVESLTRVVPPFPGKISQIEYETIYIVKLAQLTYQEWMNSEYNK